MSTPGGIFQPTDDLSAAADFLTEVTGLKVKFRDGERYAAIQYGEITLGLAAGEEKITAGPALMFKVADVPAVIAEWTAKGAKVVRGAEQGPHEVRAVLELPGGVLAVVSAKNA
ncbi:MAG: hypothetical protein U1E50_19230 [Caulobacteraceae bacterium]